jgi:hypothetical protein
MTHEDLLRRISPEPESDHEQVVSERRRLWDEEPGDSRGRGWTREEIHGRHDLADET